MDELKIGAHVSIAGGLENAVTKLHGMGGNALQIFSSSPRIWGITPPTDKQISEFLSFRKELKVDPVYFHATYLINLADDGRIGKASISTLIRELMLAETMSVKGTIIHIGSFKSKDTKPTKEQYDVLINNINSVLTQTPANTLFIIENAGNRKIGNTLDEIAFLVHELKNPRVKVCLDTCHLHAAGYDLSTREKFDTFFQEFDTKIGLERLELFQINDSKDELGSFRDRHENIGKGTIPEETFHLLL